MSFLISLCKIFISTEATVGLALNTTVLVLLWSRKIRSGWSTYRFGMTCTSVQGALISVLALSTCLTHLSSSQSFIMIFYGPIVYLPKVVSDFAMFMNLTLTIGIWELIPASCILQYLALCKPQLSDPKRIIISYSLSIVLRISSMPYYTVFHCPPSKQPFFDNITRNVHELAEEDVFYAYGAEILPSEQNEKAVVDFIGFVIAPSFSIAFAIFAWCSVSISRALGKFGVKLSPKTADMQRRFLTMLRLQGLLPLALLTIPVGIFITTMLLGIEMDKKTLVITFSLWTVPSVQGAVALAYVKGMSDSAAKSTRTTSKWKTASVVASVVTF